MRGFDGSVLIPATLIGGSALAVIAAVKAEESGAAPSRTGDRACNRRQAGIGGPLPIEATPRNRHSMTLSTMVTDQHRSDFELPTPRTGPAVRARRET